MVRGITKAISDYFKFSLILLCIFVPLGIWKTIDIIIWLFHNIKI
jgi:uncharacterized membrane protein